MGDGRQFAGRWGVYDYVEGSLLLFSASAFSFFSSPPPFFLPLIPLAFPSTEKRERKIQQRSFTCEIFLQVGGPSPLSFHPHFLLWPRKCKEKSERRDEKENNCFFFSDIYNAPLCLQSPPFSPLSFSPFFSFWFPLSLFSLFLLNTPFWTPPFFPPPHFPSSTRHNLGNFANFSSSCQMVRFIHRHQ